MQIKGWSSSRAIIGHIKHVEAGGNHARARIGIAGNRNQARREQDSRIIPAEGYVAHRPLQDVLRAGGIVTPPGMSIRIVTGNEHSAWRSGRTYFYGYV